MKIAFKAFSLEHVPHIIVCTLFNPLGAIGSRVDFKRFGQSSPGNAPSAGRFTKAAPFMSEALSRTNRVTDRERDEKRENVF